MTGFCHPEHSGAGSVQLAALGAVLSKAGFQIWDLGMGMQYKKDLNARNIPRMQWVGLVEKFRDQRLPRINLTVALAEKRETPWSITRPEAKSGAATSSTQPPAEKKKEGEPEKKVSVGEDLQMLLVQERDNRYFFCLGV